MPKLDMLGIALIGRDLVDKGWIKGDWEKTKQNDDGSISAFVCTEGAINRAIRLSIADEINATPMICEQLNVMSAAQRKVVVDKMALAMATPRAKAVHAYLAKMLGVASIPGWNDAKERSKDEVLKLFDDLITQLEKQREENPESVQVEYAEVIA